MGFGQKALKELFPEKDISIEIVYSGKFKPYNANVKYNYQKMVFSLSKTWECVSEEIQIGLIQSLLLKIFKSKKTTMNLDLYEKFSKNITNFSKVNKVDSVLKESFDRNNKQYFFDFMDFPNLVWGRQSFNKLGSYEYATNTIIISTVLKESPELLDYVMYHEMLHKHLKYESKNGRNYHHTPEFRSLERKWHDKDAEKKLTSFLRRKKLKKAFSFF